MSETRKFTVRVPEQFVDFEFAWYPEDDMTEPDTIEALTERAYDSAFLEQDIDFEIYDERGFQVNTELDGEPEQGDQSVSSEATRGPGTNPGFTSGPRYGA